MKVYKPILNKHINGIKVKIGNVILLDIPCNNVENAIYFYVNIAAAYNSDEMKNENTELYEFETLNGTAYDSTGKKICCNKIKAVRKINTNNKKFNNEQ